MEILALNQKNLQRAVRKFRRGGVIVYPTETAYALGGDALNPQVVKRVYQIKRRASNKPLPWAVSSITMAQRYVRFSQAELKIAREYWPGPVTLVLRVRLNIPIFWGPVNELTSVAVRVSSLGLVRFLARRLGCPLISTSANISGLSPCYSLDEVMRQFKKRRFKPDIILDAGELPKRKPSTIIKVTTGGEIEVLRKGEMLISNTTL